MTTRGQVEDCCGSVSRRGDVGSAGSAAMAGSAPRIL